MVEKGKRIQLNAVQKNRLFYGSLVLLALFSCLAVGS